MIYIEINISEFNLFALTTFSDSKYSCSRLNFRTLVIASQMSSSKVRVSSSQKGYHQSWISTHYNGNLIQSLVASSFKACALNPFQTSTLRKNNIRKQTDKVDTYIMYKTLMMQKTYRFLTFFNLDLMDLKTLIHFPQKHETTDSLKKSADFLWGSALFEITVFLQIQSASKIYLCPPIRDPYTGTHHFYAYNPSPLFLTNCFL